MRPRTTPIPEREFRDLERTLGKLDDCVEMPEARKQFIEDLCLRTIGMGRYVTFSIKEAQILARLKERYL